MKNFKLILFSEKDKVDLLKGCVYFDYEPGDCIIDVCTSKDSSSSCYIDTCDIDNTNGDGDCNIDVCGTDFDSNCGIDSCGRDGEHPSDCPSDHEEPCRTDVCLFQDH